MTVCAACGTQLRVSAKFCDECGSRTVASHPPAEYKQVTVLFADVVRSMDIAAAVDAERFREIMTGLFGRCAAVVQRYGGTVEKFIGDAIMAVFGAPLALEDHALRGCLAAWEVLAQVAGFADEVQRSDGVSLQLRIGLNSGRVVAGDLGVNPLSYTAIGEQVGLAQRMESVAPPGGVMLSASTARLVEGRVTLGALELVQIKGVDAPVPARRLLGAPAEARSSARQDPALVGRSWELGALTGILDAAIGGTGCVVGVVGPPGIGKSRIAREISALAAGRGVEVFATYCESHASEVPFQAVSSLLRTALGVTGLDDAAARARTRERAPDADPEDLLLLDDLLGIHESGVPLPAIDPDARRRRLTRLVNTASLSRRTAAVYVIEDVHWIDEVSESMVADLLTVIPHTRSLVLITYRPEYRGALCRNPNSQTITLAPLTASHTATLAAGLIGSDPSVVALVDQVADRAAGNPFFTEELVRDLVERGVLAGVRGRYVCRGGDGDFAVPATLQATIAARIDRLDPSAKRTLNAAAVLGLRFDAEQLAWLDGEAQMGELVAAELVDEVQFTPRAEYAFRHPLIQAVAYESQLRSVRADLHRRLAATIEQRHPDALDEHAALIAEHLEAAGDLPAAFGWRMRAGAWARHRDIRAARVSWDRARSVADRLPADDAGTLPMRIAPRTLLCGSTAWVSGSVADAGFDQLQELCTAAGDQVSLAVGMAGLMTALIFHSRFTEASHVASDCIGLLEAIGDPALTLALAIAPANIKLQAGEAAECLRLSQLIIDFAEGDAARGNLLIGSPLSIGLIFRGSSRYCLGVPGFRADFDEAIALAHSIDVRSFVTTMLAKYGFAVHTGVLLPDAAADRHTADALALAEQSGDDYAVDTALLVRGLVLVHEGGPRREAGMEMLARYREAYLRHGYTNDHVRFYDTELARELARIGDVDGAVETARAAVDYLFEVGDMMARGEAVRVFVEALLQRGSEADVVDARAAVDRLAAVPTDPGHVLFEVPLLRLRALLARANGDEAGYRQFADRYLSRATDVDYEGHIVLAKAMT